MASLPTSLALTSIADGSLMVAADERNNFTAVQTAVNALIAALGSGSAGQVLISGGAAAVSFGAISGSELGSGSLTSTTNIVSTTEASPTDLITLAPITFDGSTAVWLEFSASRVDSASPSGSTVIFTVSDGTTEINRVASISTPAAVQMEVPIFGRVKITPTAAAHTYKVSAFVSSTTGTPRVVASAAAAGAFDGPAYFRVVKA